MAVLQIVVITSYNKKLCGSFHYEILYFVLNLKKKSQLKFLIYRKDTYHWFDACHTYFSTRSHNTFTGAHIHIKNWNNVYMCTLCLKHNCKGLISPQDLTCALLAHVHIFFRNESSIMDLLLLLIMLSPFYVAISV